MNLDNVCKEQLEIVEELKEYGEENIVVLDDNIVLLSLKEYNGSNNISSRNSATRKLKGYNKIENSNFLVYTKNGILFSEYVDMAAMLQDSNGNTIGYVFRLSEIYEKPNELGSKAKGLIICTYIDTQETYEKVNFDNMYFIGNNIDNEIIENSLFEIQPDIYLDNFGSDYILTYNKNKYRYSNSVIILNSKGRKFSNIGKFIMR